jgi:hypothetical protein
MSKNMRNGIMKLDELLKRLENVKSDEDEINEKREITEYLAQKLGVNELPYVYYVMTKDRKIYDLESYEKFLRSNKISPYDAYVYIENIYFATYDPVTYLYPFLMYDSKTSLVYAYLSRLSLDSLHAVHASRLKYVAMAVRFLSVGRMVVEVVDIGTAVINMNLLMLIHGILNNKYIHIDEVENVASLLHSQKLFAGYDSNEALRILSTYYEKHDTSLAKDVEAIKDTYNHIFKPYRVVYDLETKQIQVSDKANDKPSPLGRKRRSEQ